MPRVLDELERSVGTTGAIEVQATFGAEGSPGWEVTVQTFQHGPEIRDAGGETGRGVGKARELDDAIVAAIVGWIAAAES